MNVPATQFSIGTWRNLLLVLSVSIAVAAHAAPAQIKAESREGKLVIRTQVSGQTGWTDLVSYVMETNSRPYLHPVRDASGKIVLTEDRPADHPWQHGIFTGFHRVNGFNYWKEDEGKQRFVRLLDLKQTSDRVSWRALVELVAPDGSVVLEEEDAITIHAPESPDTYLIDFDLLLRARDRDVRFGKFFVGGLAVRMPWDKAKPRHMHLNSNGLRDRQCEQQRAAWCNVERPFGDENKVFGIAVFDHPANPNHPSGWRADEQGLINPNISALADWMLPANQSQRFRYRLLVYAGSATREQLAKRFESFGSGETLYNGIILPREWPPRLAQFPTSVEKEPVIPPYLVSPPHVIPIDVGRQLFVDDFLIAETTLKRTFHLAKYHSASPVLKPDQPWEMKNPDHAAAMVFSDGIWYDPEDQLFKMWYMVGESAGTGYAISRDGIRWEKPSLDVRPPTNIVQPGSRDSSTVWLDLEERDPARRFKMFRVIGAGGEDPATGWNNWVMAIHFSADGIHWGEPVAKSGRVVDRSTVFWNPFRKVWVYSIRHVYKVGNAVDKTYGFPRRRSYVEGSDLLAAAKWDVNEPLRWTDVDRLDPQRDDLKVKPQLYNLDAVAYESLMVGFFTIWRGQPADRHKPNDVVLGYGRDGWHWSRPDRRAFCPVSDRQGDWNANNAQSAGGGFLVVGDELYFYLSGRTGRPGSNKAGTLSTGLATLRRDGFASMDAGETEGRLTTRPVRFNGKHMFVNVDNPEGELRVEILNEADQVLPRFTRQNCVPMAANKTLQAVRWKGAEDLSSLADQPVRFRFHLKNGKLYSFWVSPESSGASHGYVAAGGPGFSSNRDTP